MNRYISVLPTLGMILGLTSITSPSWGDEHDTFTVANVFFELNDTDGDLGVHALVDGGPWSRLEIEDPKERKMLNINVRGRLRRQGLTEIFFESAEPTFDELPAKRFFKRFPEGTYEVEGMTLEGQELQSEAEITHTMPAPPKPTVNGQPMAEQCDEEEPGYDITEVSASAPVVIAWPEITMSHPDAESGGAGVQPPIPVNIHNYEVVVEVELEVNGEEFASNIHVVLPPGETSMTIPDEFISQGDEFKYEVLAREESFNQTAVESCFVLVEE